METLESGATIVSGMEAENIVEAVTLAVSLPWSARYEFEEDYSPSVGGRERDPHQDHQFLLKPGVGGMRRGCLERS